MTPIPTRRTLRRERLHRDVRTAVVALLVSTVVMATPSVAARITDADSVDGLSAVRATSSAAARKGRLVATDSRGLLPDNIIRKAPDAESVDGINGGALVPKVAARGEIQRGGFSAWGGGADSYLSDVVTFHSQLPVAIPPARTTYIAVGQQFTPECPGYGQVTPLGWACLYEVSQGSRRTHLPFDGTRSPIVSGVGRNGFHLYYDCTGISCWSYGGWAVRTGTTSDVGAPAAPSRVAVP